MRKLLLFTILFTQSYAFCITPEEKAKIVQNVYNKVYSAMGLTEEKPKFLFDTKQSSMIAYMMNNKDGFPMIGFEEKAFDVCATFGARRDDAIAYLIGHEISHHHLKHHWGKDFSSAYSVKTLGGEIRGLDKDGVKRFETQADERGGILCYLAGFNTSGISEKLLTDLYTAYALKDSPKYPSLTERIQIAKDQDSIVSTYIKVFEAGNYAMMLSEYDAAISCYEYIIGKAFHSREIYNNLGVIYFLKASELAGTDEMKYIYPVEIDIESIKSRGGQKGFGDDVKEIFIKAYEKFEQATGFDKTYSTGYLNMACIKTILGEYDEAELLLRKAMKLAKEEGRISVEDNAKLVLAILHDKNPEGQKEMVAKYLNELVAKNHDYAIYNQAIINGTPSDQLTLVGKPLGWTSEDEAAVSSNARPTAERIENIRDFTSVDVKFTEEIRISRMDLLYTGTRDESLILHVPSKENGTIVFHSTLSNYAGQMSKGLKLGATEKQLIEAYGIPSVIFSSRQGWIYTYPKNKMMVFVNQTKTIDKWVVYSQL